MQEINDTTMKNKIYILILICFITAATKRSFSQNYLSLFGDTSTTWDIIPHGYCDAVVSETIMVDGDTTIGANTYKVISGLKGFIREDTTQGKAWFYDSYNNTEYLVMDLSLNLGDTFNLYNFSNVANPFLVDSVFYVSSKKHVRLNAWTSICGSEEKITFIEGSGTTASFIYHRVLFGSWVYSYMLCQHKNGVKVAGNNLFMDTCYVYSVGIEEYNSDLIAVKVFPNPTFDELTIETINSSSKNLQFSLFNLLGEKIIFQELANKLSTIDVSSLQKGVFFVVVSDGNSNYIQKVIKQ